jgi:GntR family transcriptional regulator
MLDGIPTCHDMSIIPLQRVPGLEHATLEDTSLYEALEELSGVRVVRSDYVVHAESAQADVAELLRVSTGAPVLVGEEVASDVSGTPLLMGRVTYRGDAYEFQATLYRSNERTAD